MSGDTNQELTLARKFGLCPVCGRLGRKADIGRARYNGCPEHGVYWLAAWNPWDAPIAEPEVLEAHWAAAFEVLKGWRAVTPAYPPSPSREAFAAKDTRQRERVAQLRMLADALEAMHPFDFDVEFGQRDFDSYSF